MENSATTKTPNRRRPLETINNNIFRSQAFKDIAAFENPNSIFESSSSTARERDLLSDIKAKDAIIQKLTKENSFLKLKLNYFESTRKEIPAKSPAKPDFVIYEDSNTTTPKKRKFDMNGDPISSNKLNQNDNYNSQPSSPTPTKHVSKLFSPSPARESRKSSNSNGGGLPPRPRTNSMNPPDTENLTFTLTSLSDRLKNIEEAIHKIDNDTKSSKPAENSHHNEETKSNINEPLKPSSKDTTANFQTPHCHNESGENSSTKKKNVRKFDYVRSESMFGSFRDSANNSSDTDNSNISFEEQIAKKKQESVQLLFRDCKKYSPNSNTSLTATPGGPGTFSSYLQQSTSSTPSPNASDSGITSVKSLRSPDNVASAILSPPMIAQHTSSSTIVPISDLPLFKSKMTEWRSKYTSTNSTNNSAAS